MKVVREHINEKFSEESDPIEDMGIGIGGLIEDYKKKVIKEKGWTRGQTLGDLDTAAELVRDMSASGWYSTKKDVDDEQFELYMRMLEHILKQGHVDVNAPNTYILSGAMGLKHPKPRRLELLKLLIKYGLKIKTLDNLISSDDDKDKTEALKLLAKAGILQRKPKFVPIFKNNVLYWAAQHGNMELVKFALEEGADPSYKNNYALQAALEKDKTELIKILIKYLQNNPKYK